MTQRTDGVWRVLDEQVAAGRFPGYVAALRVDGEGEIRAGGRTAVDAGSPPMAAPMTADTLFRIASVTKPIGAALTLCLVRDGALALDDPAARWLPELADPRVLISADAPLDRTTTARRPITVRHLLTLTCGWGAVMEPTPLQAAMFERGVYPGPLGPELSGDEFVARVAALPLAFQPGEGWLYHTGIDLLGVLLTRATGRSLGDLLAERITGPLGMTGTAFWATDAGRLATAYRPGPAGLEVFDPPDGAFARPPLFESLGGGLVATAPDLLRFFTALADGGAPVLEPAEVARMTGDALTGEQRAQAAPLVGPGGSWGLGTGVVVRATDSSASPGSWGWTGGTGTSARVDPARGTIAVLLTQRLMTGPRDVPTEFWTAVARAAASRAATGT